MYHRFKWTAASHRRNGISQEYEPLQPYFLLALMQAAGCKSFVDVGANIGAYSVLMSQQAKQLIAFEANPAAADEMAENLALNGLEAQLRRVAVSDHCGTLQFGTVSRLAGNSAVVETADNQSFVETDEVECVTLDSALSEIEQPIALKIDVEGHEAEVLKGAVKTMSRPCVLQVESLSGEIEIDGLRRLTAIGPDHYFTNVSGIEPLVIFEEACRLLIAANHETKSAALKMGSLSLVVSGKPYHVLRNLVMKRMGKRL
ncbi:MAG: FkbM family methyltransferase [Erythrobacter sp.]